jgi:hypothetical protein
MVEYKNMGEEESSPRTLFQNMIELFEFNQDLKIQIY